MERQGGVRRAARARCLLAVVAVVLLGGSCSSSGDDSGDDASDGDRTMLLDGDLLKNASDDLVADVCASVAQLRDEWALFRPDGLKASYQHIADAVADEDSAQVVGEIAAAALAISDSLPSPDSPPADDAGAAQRVQIAISQTNVALGRLQLACAFEGYAPTLTAP